MIGTCAICGGTIEQSRTQGLWYHTDGVSRVHRAEPVEPVMFQPVWLRRQAEKGRVRPARDESGAL